jgi:type IV pilus assembly protein PilE
MTFRPMCQVSARGLGRGFTLVEMMIVLAIIAILAAIAIPNYTEFINRGRRAEVKACLLQNAQIQERRRTVENSYGGVPGCPANVALYYTIAIDATATTFTLTATRTGSMAGDVCGDFTFNERGLQGAVNGTRDAGECWAR